MDIRIVKVELDGDDMAVVYGRGQSLAAAENDYAISLINYVAEKEGEETATSAKTGDWLICLNNWLIRLLNFAIAVWRTAIYKIGRQGNK